MSIVEISEVYVCVKQINRIMAAVQSRFLALEGWMERKLYLCTKQYYV